MAIRTILVPTDESEITETVLRAALAVARQFSAHIEALYTRPDPHEAIPFVFGTLSLGRSLGRLRDTIMEEAGKAAHAQADSARRLFETFCAEHGIPIVADPQPGTVCATWREVAGHETSALGHRGHLNDLIVVAQPKGESPAPVTLETALMDTGRPVLIVPPKRFERVGSHAVIGWNSSAHATRAVAAALPFLTAAEQVTVLSSPHKQDAATDLSSYLACHGIAASVGTLAGSAHSAGDALLKEADALNADLLVAGGYSHSRAREIFFGGATRQLLIGAQIPILMMH